MKHANSASRAISAFVLCYCGVSIPAIAEESAVGSIHVVRAELALVAPAQLGVAPSRQLGKLPALNWRAIDLPHSRARDVVPTSIDTGSAEADSVTAWYRIVVPASQTSRAIALYLPRWHTWGDLSIYADDALIYSSFEELSSNAFNRPLLIRLPFVPKAGAPLIIHIRMDSATRLGGALSTVWLGSMADLRMRYEARSLLQQRVPLLTSATFLLVGLFSLGVWTRRRHESMYLLFFALSGLVFLRNLHYYVQDSIFSEGWLGWVTVNSLGWQMIVVYVFGFRFHGRRYPITESVLIGGMLIASLLTIPRNDIDSGVIGPLAYLVYIAVAFGVTSLLTYSSIRSRSAEGALLSGTLWLNLALGTHDWMLQNWKIDIEQVYLMPFGAIAVSGLFLYFVLRRYLSAISSAEEASLVLETKLTTRERELNESHTRLREVEQAQLLSQERQRLMRDMHDGVGSALMSSLLAVERGQLQPQDIAQILRECVDDLKLTIDSLEPIDDDLLVLLATLRYRLEPRLTAAGLKLDWNVGELPRLAWLNPASALQIMRILQEVLTNILKHAQAQTIRVSTKVSTDHIEIAIADDGIGFDTQQSTRAGRGLKNLTRRASDIGGRTEIESGKGGTTVTIRLPVTQGGEFS